MARVLTIIFLIIFMPISLLQISNKGNFLKGKSDKLGKDGKVITLDKVCFVCYEDVDNDREKEIAFGIMRYTLKAWSSQQDYGFAEIGNDPLPGNLLLVLYKLRQGVWRKAKEITLLEDVYLTPFMNIRVGDFNNDKKTEIFVTADAAQTYPACVYLLEKDKLNILYEGPIDRAEVELRNINEEPSLEILEKGPTWHIAIVEEQEGILKGHVLAIRVFKWESKKRKWIFWKIVPDTEAERRLTKKELFEQIGAEELLKNIPKNKLKEIYPRAFK